ncbi:MAG: hypothetical protein R3B84_16390 [Zavarzinella sp.]
MAKTQEITAQMDFSKAIEISKTYSLEILLENFLEQPKVLEDEDEVTRALNVSCSAKLALAECSDPRTMKRMTDCLKEQGTRWCDPIIERLKNQAIPKSERAIALRALTPFVNNKTLYIDFRITAISALAWLYPHPIPSQVIAICHENLTNSHFGMASAALWVILSLHVNLRDEFVPELLHLMLTKFAGNSEANWIVERLPDHFDSHQQKIVAALRKALSKPSYKIIRAQSFFEILPRLGMKGKMFIRDIIGYISRESSFGLYEPRLIHIDPEGKKSIPLLIKLAANDSAYVRQSAIDELAAYGPLAKASIPVLNAVKASGDGNVAAFDAHSARRALELINMSN